MITPSYGEWLAAIVATVAAIHIAHFPIVAERDFVGHEFKPPVADNDNEEGGRAA